MSQRVQLTIMQLMSDHHGQRQKRERLELRNIYFIDGKNNGYFIIPLYHSDIFIKENVGTEEQREDLKKQIIHAKENNIGNINIQMRVVGDLIQDMKCEWLYDEMKQFINANKMYFDKDPVFTKCFLKNAQTLDLIYGQM